jgi:serine O-acetyltransferase
MRWLTNYRRDLQRYVNLRPGQSKLVIFCTEQGLWALLQFRLASGIYQSNWPWPVKRALLGLGVMGQKLVEIMTGISLPYQATIGPGLHIGHFGGIIVHPEVIMGENCNISQGVTLGIAGRKQRRGVPRIGNRVYIGPNAVVVGPIQVGDEAMIGANSLVNRDVAEHTTVAGVPASFINAYGSADYLEPASTDPSEIKDKNGPNVSGTPGKGLIGARGRGEEIR